MKHYRMNKALLFLISILLLSSCISTKKHELAIQTLEDKQSVLINQKTRQWEAQLNQANNQIEQLKLNLAERKGENNILVGDRKSLNQEIERLETEIERMGNQSISSQQSYGGRIREKEQEIARLKGILKDTELVLERHVVMMGSLANDVREAFKVYTEQSYTIESGTDKLKLIFPESVLFKPKSNTKLEVQGQDMLSRASQVILKHPNMLVTVIAHTDNTAPKRRSDLDNWNVSVVRAAAIVRYLTQDFDISANQLTAAGKGEFEPIASNSSAEGQAMNRRVEFVFRPLADALPKAIKGTLLRQ